MAMGKNGTMLWVMLAVGLTLILTACGGCTDFAPGGFTDSDITVIPGTTSPAPPPGPGQQGYGNLVIDVPEFVQHWKADGTCFWQGQIKVTNTGETPIMNVVIRSYLMRTTDNRRVNVDSKTFERVNSGASLYYTSQVFGTCDTGYYIVVKADTE